MHNKISLIGNVGGDPEIRTVGDSKFASISLGVTEKGYTAKDGRKVEDRTTWFRVGLWKGLADIVEKYVVKGDRLFVEGKMLSREYEDKNGQKHTAWEITATEIELLSSKKNDGKGSQTQPAPVQEQRQEDGLPF